MVKQVLVLVLPSDWARAASAPERCLKPTSTHPRIVLSEIEQ